MFLHMYVFSPHVTVFIQRYISIFGSISFNISVIGKTTAHCAENYANKSNVCVCALYKAFATLTKALTQLTVISCAHTHTKGLATFYV